MSLYDIELIGMCGSTKVRLDLNIKDAAAVIALMIVVERTANKDDSYGPVMSVTAVEQIDD